MAPLATGTLEAIWIKRAHRGPMDPTPRATLVAGAGLVGNADQGTRRQVTIIAHESWRALSADLGVEIDPSLRRANLMVRGVPLADMRGRVLQVGRCRIRIRGETTPCERMDEAHAGLLAAMRPAWRGGAYGEVLDDGDIAVGDVVRWLDEPADLAGGKEAAR